MYGGDEVSAIVLDMGSHTCKAGYAGEDAPKAVFPSVVGAIDQMDIDESDNAEKNSMSAVDSKNNLRSADSDKAKNKRKLYVGSQSLGYRRDHMEVLSPFKDGIVSDWDIVDSIWDHAFRECLLIDPKEHPMLLAEPSSNTQQQRERTAELMFEKYKAPALFLAKNAVLTSFASGRATSLVVDSGGGSTTVAPVHDGYVLQKAVATSPIGGELLSDCLMKSLESKGIVIKPRYSFRRKEIRPGEFQTVDLDFPNTTESYKLYSQRVIVGDIKECVCRAPDTPYDESAYSNIPMTPYELPDGQTIEIGADRFKIPDVIFTPSLVQTIPGMESFAEIAPSVRGLPQMVIESINKCDVDIRRELFSSILLAGGTASMQQLKERLEKDLLEKDNIHVSIRKSLTCKFEKDLKEGIGYTMINFVIDANVGSYRTTRHRYKLDFQFETQVRKHKNVVPINVISFTRLSEVFGMDYNSDYLVGKHTSHCVTLVDVYYEYVKNCKTYKC